MSDSPSGSSSGGDLLAQIASIVEAAQQAIGVADSLDALRHADSDHLGKASKLSALKSQMGTLDHEGKRSVGKALNEARTTLEALVAQRRDAFEAAERASRLEAERLDLSEAIVDASVGHMHLISQTLERLEDVFCGLGFTVAEGPEVETDWYNFEALNMPEGHPARSMWDTLYLEAGEPETILLRTHTSPVQVRTMMRQEPPIYIVAPGRAFRSDTADATHLPVFHQIEGLVVDRGITFADLQGTIEAFVKALYGPDRRTRLRPSYFPFTEPSAEFDMTTASGEWVELGGCGMVNPNVLRSCGLDPEEWSGFAFGFGIERMAMQRHGMDDIREFVTNDVRFLAQF
ncbi:MAG TPA: phenylalanine--tRNA ligase subunit alpha [Microthrixaceae bacterium]|nr:phenylalanine--tRNA ligase subunit alpha [Microthrixaceae bacterium]